ncbi:MAG: PadR family transcriptional regulator [Planctomycetales bacterium]|nr:PadR family transcriptional regulator [Planctomycetales bacterium]
MSNNKRKRRTNPDFLNGVPELVVLQLLQRRAMYGYELVQAIREESACTLDFGEGCIYPLLHKLEERGDLASRRIQVGPRSRVVYRVTPKGNRSLAATATQWSQISAAITNIMQGSKHVAARFARQVV